jgi:hypothetical protein
MLSQMGLDGETAPPTTHAPGRGSAVTQAEALDIRLMYLSDGLSISELARRSGRTRETISKVVKHPDTGDLRKIVEAEKVERAKQKLRAAVDVAAQGWVDAIPVAAQKGDHRPAKDLLLTEKVVEPVVADRSGGGIVVQIGISAADVRLGVYRLEDLRLGDSLILEDGRIAVRRVDRRGEYTAFVGPEVLQDVRGIPSYVGVEPDVRAFLEARQADAG